MLLVSRCCEAGGAVFRTLRAAPRLWALSGIIAALLCVLGTGSARAAEEVRVGLMAPLTGKWASEGEDARRAITLLADMWNSSGKLGGRVVRLEIEDDAGDPRTGALAAQRLLSKGAAVVIGAYGSSVTEAAQQLLAESGVTHISSGATAVRLTEKGLPRFFRIGPRDDGQSAAAARHLARRGFKTVAVVHDNSAHPQGFAEEARERLAALGVRVALYDALAPGQRDYTVLLSKVRAARPDGFLFTGYYPETGLLLRQKAEMGWDVPMFGGDASNHKDLVSIAGKKAARGFRFCSAAMPGDLDAPEARRFLRAFEEKYGTPPLSGWAMLSAEAFDVAAAAVAAGRTTSEGVALWLHDLRRHSGLTGNVSFDAKGDREGDLYHIYEVDAEGRFRLVKEE